jgi:hypothetical protein
MLETGRNIGVPPVKKKKREARHAHVSHSPVGDACAFPVNVPNMRWQQFQTTRPIYEGGLIGMMKQCFLH